MDDHDKDPRSVATSDAASPTFGKIMSFARRHPALSLVGVAGVGLFGGLEVAAGVLLGAGAVALIGRDDRTAASVDRAPREITERLRAAVRAMRGEPAPGHRRNGQGDRPGEGGEPAQPH